MIERKIKARAGQHARIRMAFDCNLAPGVYFLNCGAGAVRDGERVMLHRILDGLTFRVVDAGKQVFSGSDGGNRRDKTERHSGGVESAGEKLHVKDRLST